MAMSIIVVAVMIVGVVIICSAIATDMLIMIAPLTFDERLEKCPHPCRKRGNACCQIGFNGRADRRILEKLGKFAAHAVTFTFAEQNIAKPVKRLNHPHCRSSGPEQFAGGCWTKGDRHIAELDRSPTCIGMDDNFCRNSVCQTEVICCSHSVYKHTGLIAAPNGIDNRARIGRIGLLS